MFYLQLVTFLIIFGFVRPQGKADTAVNEDGDDEPALWRCVEKYLEKPGIKTGTPESKKCEAHCFMIGLRIIVDDKLNPKRIREIFKRKLGKDSEAAANEIENTCSAIKATGKCEFGYQVAECYENIIKKKFS